MMPVCPNKRQQIDLATHEREKPMSNHAQFQYEPTNGRRSVDSALRHFGSPLAPIGVSQRIGMDTASVSMFISKDGSNASIWADLTAKQLREAACALLDAAYTIENPPTAEAKEKSS